MIPPSRTFTIRSRRTALVLILGIVLAVAAACSLPSFGSSAAAPELPEAVPEDLRELWEVWEALQEDYVAPELLDPTVLSRGAISGMLEALNDPYTHFINPDRYEMQIAELEGVFEGIGAVVATRDGRIVIVSPIRGSPAERAGLRPGAIILAVDGESTEGMTLTQVVDRIRGESGSTVVLRIAPEPDGAPEEISIVRGTITVPTIAVEAVAGGRVAHITLASFTSQTDEDLRQTLENLDMSTLVGIVLDLRNNPGGLVDTAIGVVSEFVNEGVALYEVDRLGNETAREVSGDGVAFDVPMVVLVNAGSASASEIVAGALQARGRATLIGETTFGKGSVTLLKRLSTSAGLFVTSARWLTPDRELVEGIGLTPDVTVVDDPLTEADEALTRAVNVLLR